MTPCLCAGLGISQWRLRLRQAGAAHVLAVMMGLRLLWKRPRPRPRPWTLRMPVSGSPWYCTDSCYILSPDVHPQLMYQTDSSAAAHPAFQQVRFRHTQLPCCLPKSIVPGCSKYKQRWQTHMLLGLQETTRQELQGSQEELLAARVDADRAAWKLQQAGIAMGPFPTGKENALPEVDVAGGAAQHSAAEGAAPVQDAGFIRGYLNRIAQLEKEIRRLKEVRTACEHYEGFNHIQAGMSAVPHLHVTLAPCQSFVCPTKWLPVSGTCPASASQSQPAVHAYHAGAKVFWRLSHVGA